MAKELKSQMFFSGIGGDQIRAKGRVKFELTLVRWAQTCL